MRILFGIAIVALVAFTAWSVEPTVGKTPSTVSLDPVGMMGTTAICPNRTTTITAPFTDRPRDPNIDLRIGWPVSLPWSLPLPGDQGAVLPATFSASVRAQVSVRSRTGVPT